MESLASNKHLGGGGKGRDRNVIVKKCNCKITQFKGCFIQLQILKILNSIPTFTPDSF